MRILIYSPSNLRAVDQQSQGELLLKSGHEIYLLTWTAKGPLHENFEKLGAKVFSAEGVKGRSLFFFINQCRFLISFSRKNKIDVIFSHLQGNAVVSGLAKYFIKARCYYFRHNSDYIELTPSRKNKFLNRWANKLSPYIVAISGKVKEQLIKEGVPEKKIIRINYCYNFSHYRKNTTHSGPAIREKYKASLLLLTVARLDPLKRHTMIFDVVMQLAARGVDCKLISIGEGPMREELQQWIEKNQMNERIFLEKFAANTIDYFEACDMLIHLSYSEASSHVVKEAGMCKRTVVACKNVGDFNDYLQQEVNSFVVDKEKPVMEAVELLAANFNNKDKLQQMGEALYEKVINTFSMEAVEKDYQKLFN
jgi:glycosyltransferase involved in cell wall biosynthesis